LISIIPNGGKILKDVFSSYYYFVFVEDEDYKKTILKDYENYKSFFNDWKYPKSMDDEISKRQHPYGRFHYSDKRIPKKYKKFIGVCGQSLSPRLPIPKSREREIINEMVRIKLNFFASPKGNFLKFWEFIKTKELDKMYIDIINV
jgi:hypothetical protein